MPLDFIFSAQESEQIAEAIMHILAQQGRAGIKQVELIKLLNEGSSLPISQQQARDALRNLEQEGKASLRGSGDSQMIAVA